MTTPEPDPQVQNVVHSAGTAYQVGELSPGTAG